MPGIIKATSLRLTLFCALIFFWGAGQNSRSGHIVPRHHLYTHPQYALAQTPASGLRAETRDWRRGARRADVRARPLSMGPALCVQPSWRMPFDMIGNQVFMSTTPRLTSYCAFATNQGVASSDSFELAPLRSVVLLDHGVIIAYHTAIIQVVKRVFVV